MPKTAALLCFALAALAGAARARAPALPTPHQADYVISNFRFADGETLPELRIHYRTLGTLRRDAQGHATNAILLLHGTGGSGAGWFTPQFAGQLFGPAQLLDVSRYYLIMPDDIGHGASSKPSDGLKGHFPHYGYADMVEAEHRLVTEGLHVDRLRLLFGTSMGCMHAFMWGEDWPTMSDALMPMACLPVQIAGRNRLFRAAIADAIRGDPDWKGGDYVREPLRALRTVSLIEMIAGMGAEDMQKDFPTRDAADHFLTAGVYRRAATLDANDDLYQTESSRDYDPSARLGEITAPVMWINSADDFINPPELGIAEREAPKLKRGRFVLLPAGPNTHGHGTHSWAAAWKGYMAELLKESER